MMDSDPGAWVSPLPNFSRPAVSHVLRVGDRVFRLVVSNVQDDVPDEPDTHLIQLAIFLQDQPLTLFDLGINTPEACANLWAYLTNRITETVVQFYAPSPREFGELNPRLGCWGPRPDLVTQGLGATDCALAAVIGISIWLPGSRPPVHAQTFLEALRDTLTDVLGYWIATAHRAARQENRRN